MAGKGVHKRRRIDSSIKSYFLPQSNEDPLAPPLRKMKHPPHVKQPSSPNKEYTNNPCKKTKSEIPNKTNKPPSLFHRGNSEQLYLDFGQKSFGRRTICPICNMLYVHGVQEDESQHNKICREYKFGVSFPRWKNERLIHNYPKEEKIVEVRMTDPPRHMKKIEEIKGIIDKDMSFAPTRKPPTLTHFLYISATKKIIGYLSAHPLSTAFPLIANDSSVRSQTPRNAALGIYQIWTLKSSRRNGVAQKLLDAARAKVVYGMIVGKGKVAFSSPTEEGIRFAKAFVGEGKEVLVYDC